LAIENWDLIIAEQVLEHLISPHKAICHAYEMLRPNGWFIVTTPFLIKLHPQPNDCSRWTETGLENILAENGFSNDNIQTGSWGNKQCVIANFNKWVKYKPLIHSLNSEPDFPIVVWAYARKS